MGYAKIINYQSNKVVDAKSTRIWLTNVYIATNFSSYVRGEIGNQILKRIIVNGETGSSCL